MALVFLELYVYILHNVVDSEWWFIRLHLFRVVYDFDPTTTNPTTTPRERSTTNRIQRASYFPKWGWCNTHRLFFFLCFFIFGTRIKEQLIVSIKAFREKKQPRLASGSKDGTIKIWNCETYQLLHTIRLLPNDTIGQNSYCFLACLVSHNGYDNNNAEKRGCLFD